MDKGYEKERFKKLGIKVSVAIRFRQFCKKMSKSQSMTLLLMIEFFEENSISPAESIGSNMKTLDKRISVLIKKRINGMIAIMKDIEKNQTKPIVAMMQALFQAAEQPKKKLILAKEIKEVKNEVRFREKKYLNNNDDV